MSSIRAHEHQGPLLGVIGLLLIVLAAFVAGVAVPLGLGPVMIVLAGFFLTLMLFLAGSWRSYQFGGEGLLWSAVLLTFPCEFITNFTPYNANLWIEVWLILVTPLVLAPLYRWSKDSPFCWWLIAWYSTFLVLALLSSFYGDSMFFPAIYQLLYNLKIVAMLLLGFRVGWSEATERRFWRFVGILCVFSLAVAAWELTFPESYYGLAVGVSEGGPWRTNIENPFLPFMGRVTGPYEHSGLLALFSCFMFAAVVVRILALKEKVTVGHYAMAAGFGLLVALSGQRQETAGLIVVVLIVFAIFRLRFNMRAVMFTAALVGVGFVVVLVLLGTAQIDSLLVSWGIEPSFNSITDSRAVFYYDATKLADEYYPLGTGLGTYGGVGAQKFDFSVYQHLGYSKYWWFRRGLFLTDTYWPNFIAEAGWFGALAFFVFVASLICYSLVMAWRSEESTVKELWAIAFAGQALVMVISLTSPLYSDPNYVAMIMMFFGIAYMKGRPAARAASQQLIREWPRMPI